MGEWGRRGAICAVLAALGAPALAPRGALAAPAPGDPREGDAGRILARFRARHRLLVVCGDGPGDAAARAEIAFAAGDPAGFQERDLLLVEALGAASRQGGDELGPSAELRRELGLAPTGFALALVGKDGGVKLRARRPVSLRRLYAQIDAMPMRRDEMAERGPRT